MCGYLHSSWTTGIMFAYLLDKRIQGGAAAAVGMVFGRIGNSPASKNSGRWTRQFKIFEPDSSDETPAWYPSLSWSRTVCFIQKLAFVECRHSRLIFTEMAFMLSLFPEELYNLSPTGSTDPNLQIKSLHAFTNCFLPHHYI